MAITRKQPNHTKQICKSADFVWTTSEFTPWPKSAIIGLFTNVEWTNAKKKKKYHCIEVQRGKYYVAWIGQNMSTSRFYSYMLQRLSQLGHWL